VYELLGDERRGAVVAIEGGAIAWRREVVGHIELAAATEDRLSIVVDGKVRQLDATGAMSPPVGEVRVGGTGRHPYALTSDVAALLDPGAAAAPPPAVDLVFDPAARTLTRVERGGATRGVFPWPAGALPPEPHHHADGVVWMVFPDHVEPLDVR
jgi:hypothetical protein